jgi:hypothetical protein
MFLVQSSKLQEHLKLQHAAVISLWDKKAPVPPQSVVISKDLLKKIESEHTSADLLINHAINDSSLAVTEEFSVTALNSINSLYYGCCIDAFNKKSSLATFFVKNRMAQYVILNAILERVKDHEFSIKEICCGAVYSRWQHFDKFLPNGRKIKAILSDLTEDIIPKERLETLNLKNIDFEIEAYDLRDPMPFRDEKVDVMFVTYGFDSVWLEDDVMYVKHNNEWFRIKYRVKVLPTAKQPEKLLSYLREGFTTDPVYLEDFDNVVVETLAEKVDILKVPYGKYIQSLYGEYEEARTIVPGGIIKRVQEAFENQIKDDGIFVIGEVATYPIKPDEKIELTVVDYNTTGKVGKYKVEDFYLAEAILKDIGYSVEVLDMEKEAKRLGKTIDEDCEDTWLMVVQKNG